MAAEGETFYVTVCLTVDMYCNEKQTPNYRKETN
jgi:hypothetical protein